MKDNFDAFFFHFQTLLLGSDGCMCVLGVFLVFILKGADVFMY